MRRILTVAAMREADAKAIAAGTPGRVLMGRAAEALFRARCWLGPTAILCGSGNNGGDGYALALLLQETGVPVKLLRLEDRFSPDGRYYYQRCLAAGIPDRLYESEADLVGCRELVDCLFGTGFHGSAAGRAEELIRAVNHSGAWVLAADIPSGLNGENGLGDPAIRADCTVSIAHPQPGHYLNRGKDCVGRLLHGDIGIPAGDSRLHLCEDSDLAALCVHRPNLSNKGDYGYVGLLGGCRSYGGAAKLANLSMAALRCGCGVSTLAVPQGLAAAVTPFLLESTLLSLPERDGFMTYVPEKLDGLLERVRALGLGMGWGQGPDNGQILTHVLERFNGVLVLDADGLNTLAALGTDRLDNARPKLVLTPHLREFSRLSGLSEAEIREDPVGTAESFAKTHGVILLLKGPSTVVTDGAETWLTDAGCPGMATAGSGDVLTGILTGLLGWASCCPKNVALAAHLNGRAGEAAQRKQGAVSMTAGDTVNEIPRILYPRKERAMTYYKRIPMETLVNIRDLGGWPLPDGRVTKYGVFYRTDCPIGISEADKTALLARGVTLSIDLRGVDEVERTPSGMAGMPGHTYMHCPVSAEHRIIKSNDGDRTPPPPPGPDFDLGDSYIDMLEEGRPWAKKVIELCANWDGAVMFHCFIGKDRAGLIAALLLGAVGVEARDILADYSMSMSLLRPKYLQMGAEHLPQKRGRPNFSWAFFASVPESMEAALCYMDEQYGGVCGYLRACGVSEETLMKLREKLTEAAE